MPQVHRHSFHDATTLNALFMLAAAATIRGKVVRAVVNLSPTDAAQKVLAGLRGCVQPDAEVGQGETAASMTSQGISPGKIRQRLESSLNLSTKATISTHTSYVREGMTVFTISSDLITVSSDVMTRPCLIQTCPNLSVWHGVFSWRRLRKGSAERRADSSCAVAGRLLTEVSSPLL